MPAKTKEQALSDLQTLRRMKELRYEKLIRKAQSNFFTFQRVVMRTEQGDPWEPGEHHKRWDRHCRGTKRAVLFAPIEHGKSEQRTVARSLFDIGRNPNIRIGLISDTSTQAEKFLKAITTYIETSEEYNRVFPEVIPDSPWTDTQIQVQRTAILKDPTIHATGALGGILGARFDIARLDDILSFKNTLTEVLRQKIIKWFVSELVGRVVKTGRIEVIGTSWHQEDLMHYLEDTGEYSVLRDKACTLEEVNGVMRALDPLWPEQWDEERLLQRLREIKDLEFARQMMNRPLADALARFKLEWFANAFEQADSLNAKMMNSYHGEWPTFTGVDLAIGKKSIHDETAVVTIAFREDGRMQILNIRKGRWNAPKILDVLWQTHKDFDSIIMPESNAAQDYIRQWLELKIGKDYAKGFVTTGEKKRDHEYGIESLAVELQNGSWVIPRCEESEALTRSAIYYDPTSHPGDDLMAWWLSREAKRIYGHSLRSLAVSSDNVSERSDGASILTMEF